MYLDKEEEKMLSGECGAAVELAMKAIVRVGDAVEAERLVSIASSHVGNADFLSRWEACASVIRRLSEYGGRVKVPTSENPNIYDSRTPLGPSKEFGIPKDFKGRPPLDRHYRLLGVIPTWSCTPYFFGNIPRFGQHVSWEESSAVIYVNAVLGARTNRESILMDLLTAIAGKTPYYGLHLEENRRGEILFAIDKRKLHASDYPAIGYRVGKISETQVPVFVGVPKDISSDNFKNFGAAAASSGAVAHFHVPGMTPEAKCLADAFRGEQPIEKIKIGLREIRETREEMSFVTEGEAIDSIIVGCPHYSLSEVARIAQMLKGKKIRKGVHFWVYTHDGIRMLAKRLGYSDIITASNARLVTGCPLPLFKVPPYSEMSFMTDSGKISYYADVAYGSQEDCVKSGIEGKVVRSVEHD